MSKRVLVLLDDRPLARKLMPMRAATALRVIVAVIAFSGVRARFTAGNQQEVENAAVKYLRADAALRQSYTLPPDAAVKLEKALELPLNAEDERLVAAANDALVEFDHGAATKSCDWAMSIEDGPLANTAHRGAIIELASVSALRARMRFRDGDTKGAMSDVLAAMAAARHLSVDGSLASVLIAYKLEQALTEIVAYNLARFSPEQLNSLTNGLDGLPHGSSLGTAFESEKGSRNDLLTIVQQAKSRDDLIERLVHKVPALQSSKALALEIIDGCGGSVKGVLNCVNQQHAFYVSWIPRFQLPPEDFERIYEAEMKGLSAANPVIRIFTPSLPRFRWADACSQTRRALLYAAIAVRRDGPNALNRHLDPYDKKAFSYVPFEGGFRLQSRLSDGGTPITLSIVQSGGK